MCAHFCRLCWQFSLVASSADELRQLIAQFKKGNAKCGIVLTMVARSACSLASHRDKKLAEKLESVLEEATDKSAKKKAQEEREAKKEAMRSVERKQSSRLQQVQQVKAQLLEIEAAQK